MIWYDMIWYNMIWYDIILENFIIWYHMISYDIIWYRYHMILSYDILENLPRTHTHTGREFKTWGHSNPRGLSEWAGQYIHCEIKYINTLSFQAHIKKNTIVINIIYSLCDICEITLTSIETLPNQRRYKHSYKQLNNYKRYYWPTPSSIHRG